eukprot:CAMPEP_0116899494 /NCGR_PEP_ID=MMETSP0467-20121206/8047_1 /TAXON_ID=283647 /ORGANISM="Mesodinium pulex, Strain SPMC105" /LENGTH=86 /DNA_ID=CAMNT_0004572339 /DNA_START=1487 /DNA_END=1747 /DNA_ORIENTATION=-
MSDFSLLGSGGAAEEAEVDVEVILDLVVFLPVFGADFLIRHFLLDGLDFGGGSILVSAADLNGVVSHESAVPVVDVCREHAADDVA